MTRADVETAPLVTRGGWALLRSARGPVELESRVQVLQEGHSGQTVQVRLPNGNAVIAALVTGPGTVEVNE